jgi:hypothetical protein
MSPDGQEAEINRGLGLAERNAILLAGDASSYTTGRTIFVEGGRVGTIS